MIKVPERTKASPIRFLKVIDSPKRRWPLMTDWTKLTAKLYIVAFPAPLAYIESIKKRYMRMLNAIMPKMKTICKLIRKNV